MVGVIGLWQRWPERGPGQADLLGTWLQVQRETGGHTTAAGA